MKKIITLAAMAAAVLAGCTKQEVPAAVETDTQEAQYITMNAGFVNADTKLAFEADGTGYKTTWTNQDVPRLFVNNFKSGTEAIKTARTDNSVTPDSQDATKATIKLDTTGLNISAAPLTWGIYVSNGHTSTTSYGYWTDNYGTQDGTEAKAQELIFFYAGVDGSANASTSSTHSDKYGNDFMNEIKSPVSFACKNTMLKFTLTFPGGVTGTASDITISGTNIYTTANYSWGLLAASASTTGSIKILDQTITDGKITFWATVAPATVSGVEVSATVGDITYKATVGDKELAAGKVYNIARNLTPSVKTVWAYDIAGSEIYSGPAADNGKKGKNGYITYDHSNQQVTWTANETGKPRTDTLVFSNGNQFVLNQLEAKDFVGNYTFYNYSFFANSNTTLVDHANRKDETTVTISLHSSPEQLSGKTYNLELTGLYNEFIMPVSFELTDKGPSFYTYLSDESQSVTNNITTTSDSLNNLSMIDVVIVPEESGNATWSTKSYAPKTFGTDNKYWGKWNFEDLFTEPKIVMGSGEDRKIETGCYFAGFSVVLKDYSQIPYDPSKTRAYVTIYQMNYCNKWVYSTAGGAYFKKN